MIKKLTKRNASIQKNTAVAFTTKEKLHSRLGKDMKKNWILYVMILPVVIYYVVFAYGPLYGIQLAFKDYIIKDGIWGSPWVGFEHFTRFFSSYNFELLLKNTIGISLYSILVGFPIPIMFALLLNYLKNKHLKKTIQMASYAPYFISTVVMCGMIVIFLNPDTGIFNTIRGWLGLESIDFLGKPELFKSIYVWTGVWQGLGWSSIIYISALSGVDYQLHEAAIVDGGTLINLVLTVCAAYPLARKDFVPRNVLMFLFMLTMYFSGGLVPTYLIVNKLHLTNTPWAMMIPGAISIYNVIITRTYFINSIPSSLQEAAELDGANTYQFLIKIVLPLSKPILAVIGLYYAVGHWNDFFSALIYINDKNLMPLQSFLRDLLMTNKMSLTNLQGLDAAAAEAKMQLSQTLKYSAIIVSTVPVLCIYPFIQKYFVKGVMIGSVKG